MSAPTFYPNWGYQLYIDKTPGSNSPTWVEVAEGITSITPNPNETVAQDAYYADDGNAHSDVTGMQMVYSVSGHRATGDDAQDYVAGLQFKTGADRTSNVKVVYPDHANITCPCTLANIVAGAGMNGDANNKGDFSFEIHLNGAPTAGTEPVVSG